jgi:phage terminase Nu1 subunit (DNA packaging protein)
MATKSDLKSSQVNLEIACQQIFGISSRRYRQLAKEHGAPPVLDGKVDILKACKFLIDYYRKLAEGQGSLSLTEERARLTKINADLKQLMLKKKQGELIEKQLAFDVFVFTLTRMAEKLKAIPAKASTLLISAQSMVEIKQTLEELINEVLNEISSPEFVRNSVIDYAGMCSNKTETKTDDKRVGGQGKSS